MSRFLPYLSELQPELYCEVSPELAEELGLEPYGWMTIVSARSAIEARVFVTERMTPLEIGGKTIHTVGLPYHWARGKEAVVTGDSVNDLIGMNLDVNTQIQGSKNNQCAIRPGRRPRGEALRELVREYQVKAGIVDAEPVLREHDPLGDPDRAADGAETVPMEVRGSDEAGGVPTGEDTAKEGESR